MMRMGSSSSMAKGSWSTKEDAQLTAMVKKHGPGQWSMISTGMPGRTGKSCRLRWLNQLSPAVKHRPFTAEEHTLISDAQSLCGNKWADIARGLNSGRTDNSVKNHWNTNKRKSQREARAATATQFAHTNVIAVAAASAADASAAAENNLQVRGKGKAVVIDLEDDEADDAGVKVRNEAPPAKRRRVSKEGGGSSSAVGNDHAWLTLSLGLPQQQQPVLKQPAEQVTKQAPMAPVATETPLMAAMREMVKEEVERQARPLAYSVLMAAMAGAAGRLLKSRAPSISCPS